MYILHTRHVSETMCYWCLPSRQDRVRTAGNRGWPSGIPEGDKRGQPASHLFQQAPSSARNNRCMRGTVPNKSQTEVRMCKSYTEDSTKENQREAGMFQNSICC